MERNEILNSASIRRKAGDVILDDDYCSFVFTLLPVSRQMELVELIGLHIQPFTSLYKSNCIQN